MGVGAVIAAVLTTILTAYPAVDSFIKDKGSKRASRVRAQLNDILSGFNGRIEDLKNGLENRGIRYNLLMDRLNGASPVGTAGKLKNRIEANYSRKNREDLQTIRDLNEKAGFITNQMEAEAQRKENVGASELFTNVPKATRTIFS